MAPLGARASAGLVVSQFDWNILGPTRIGVNRLVYVIPIIRVLIWRFAVSLPCLGTYHAFAHAYDVKSSLQIDLYVEILRL